MSERITPGLYLSKRRQAAGLSIDALPLAAEAVEAIEADVRFPTDIEIWALQSAFNFDVTILVAIGRGIIPRLCRECGCSEDDPCDDPLAPEFCCWVEEDLCSACQGTTAEMAI